MLEKIKNWTAPPDFTDPEERRSARLLNFITWAYMGLIIFSLMGFSVFTRQQFEQLGLSLFFVRVVPFLAANILAQILMRLGRMRLASIVFISLLWLGLSVVLYVNGGIYVTATTFYFLVIVASGLLLGMRVAGLVTALSVLWGTVIAVLMGRNALPAPLSVPTPLADWLAVSVAYIMGAVILYLFIQSINRAQNALREANALLKDRVERTRDLALAAEVGEAVSQITNLDKLLAGTVDLIRTRFNLYHVQIYLVDEKGQMLRLQAATGEAGQQMLDKGHALPVTVGSINGEAVVSRQSVIVTDTQASSIFRFNPLLPDTRSETAVPMIIGDKVVGVLDLQSSQPNAFGAENLPAFEVLAGQLAAAIENTRLLGEALKLGYMVTQSPDGAAIANMEGIIEFVNPSWAKMHGYDSPDDLIGQPLTIFHTAEQLEQQVKPFNILVQENGLNQDIVWHMRQDGSTFPTRMTVSLLRDEDGHPAGLMTSAQDITEELKAERQLAERVKQLDLLNDIGRQMEKLPSLARFLQWVAERVPQAMPYPDDCVAAVSLDGVIYGAAEALELPRHIVEELRLSGDRVGNIYIAYKQNYEFRDIESAFIGDIGRRVSSYIENQRLVEETQVRAAELQIVAEIGVAISAAQTIDQLLNKVVELTKERFHMYHAQIYLLDSVHSDLVLSAGAGETGRQMIAERRVISLQKEQSLVAQSARTRRSVIVNDAQHEPGFLPHPLLPETAAEIAVPLLFGEDELLGVLDIQSDIPGYFNTGHINIFTTLASQTAIALKNARQAEQTQEALQELRALQQVMTGEGWQAFMANPERSVSGYVAVDQGQAQPITGDSPIPANGEAGNVYVAPMTVRGAPIGGLGVKNADALSEEEKALLDNISQQVAEALERARLFEETEMARTRTEALYAAGDRIARAETGEDVLRALVGSTALQRMDRVAIWLFDQPWRDDTPPETAAAIAAWERPSGGAPTPPENRLILTGFPDVVSCISGVNSYIVSDVLLADELSEKTRDFIVNRLNLRSFAIFPLVVSGQWIGLVTGQSSDTIHFAEMETRQIENLTDQAATAIQNQRLLAESRERAQQEQILRRVSERVYGAVDAESVLKTAVQEVGRTLGLQAFIYLDEPQSARPQTKELQPTNGDR
ncbi:MAG TPA: GAF domain-containing protein [Anaerolineae bacterium]|nr:GAF domain-containing protein [Anaerolineae bacterium]